MSRATVFFYGRRSRPSRSFDELGFRDSSSPSSSSDHHRHRNSDPHRRHRHIHNLVDDRRSSRNRLPLPPTANEPHQEGFVGDCPSQNTTNRENAHSLSGRFSGNDRLPAPVLLAKERLLQRLRGVSISGSSSNGETETSSSSGGNDFWDVDVGWEAIDSREQSPVYNFTELPLRVRQPSSASRKPNAKFPGLTEGILTQLHHEIYVEEHQKDIGDSTSRASSNECSICLENFVQGNELVSLCCGHRFHRLCLYPWLRACGDCPNCRSCIVATSYLK